MKTIKNKLAALILSGFALSVALSSCQKKFDPSSYAPPKPPPSFGGYVTSDEVASSNLAGHWAFNGGYIDSVSGIVGVASGESFSKGILGQALAGTATGYVLSKIPPNIQNLHSFSISLWVNMAQPAGGATELISIPNPQTFWSNLDIYWNASSATTGLLGLQVNDNASNGQGANTFMFHTLQNPWNNWINIIITYDDSSGTFNVYYQGAVQGSATTVAGFAPLNWTGATQMTFGTFPFQIVPSLTSATGSQGWANNLAGTMYEVRVYNTVLNSVQAAALYNLQSAGR